MCKSFSPLQMVFQYHNRKSHLVKAKHSTQKCCVNYGLQVFHVFSQALRFCKNVSLIDIFQFLKINMILLSTLCIPQNVYLIASVIFSLARFRDEANGRGCDDSSQKKAVSNATNWSFRQIKKQFCHVTKHLPKNFNTFSKISVLFSDRGERFVKATSPTFFKNHCAVLMWWIWNNVVNVIPVYSSYFTACKIDKHRDQASRVSLSTSPFAIISVVFIVICSTNCHTTACHVPWCKSEHAHCDTRNLRGDSGTLGFN